MELHVPQDKTGGKGYKTSKKNPEEKLGKYHRKDRACAGCAAHGGEDHCSQHVGAGVIASAFQFQH